MNTDLELYKKRRLEEIRKIIVELVLGNFEVQGSISELSDEYDAIITGLNALAEELLYKTTMLAASEKRIEEFCEVVISIASLDYTKKASVGDEGNEFDAVAAGLNVLSEELKYSQEQLIRKEKFETIGKLSGNIAHELRNPLGVIGNSLFYLDMTLKEKEGKVKKHLNIIKNQVAKSNQIIGELLDFVKIKKLFLIEVNINFIIKAVLDSFELPKNIILNTKLDAKIPKIQVDQEKISQVFHNIILNAVQAMPKGGTLEIHTQMQKYMIEVIFKDTGEGILKETLPKIFEPLFSTKVKGIGLGLSIVQEIVNNHNGMIEVESKVGEGSTFTIKLPTLRKEVI